MKRVLLIGTAYAIREHSKKLDYLARRCALTCVTAELAPGVGWTERVERHEERNGFHLFGLATGGGLSMPDTRGWYRGLAKVIARSSYDLILVENEPWGVLRWQAWCLAKLHQRRALFGEFTWENIERTGWRGAVLQGIYRLANRTTDFRVAGNRGARDLLVRSGADPATTTILPQFGVDPVIFAPADPRKKDAGCRRHALPGTGCLIGFCGRLVEQKGIRTLLEAFALLPAETCSATLVLVGQGPLEPAVDEAARSNPRILRRSPMTYPAIAEFLGLLDVLVLPSQTLRGPPDWWREQFGHILIEAMACGIAVIGSSCGAIPEVLGDLECIFPEGNAAALANRLERAINQPEWRQKQAERGRRRVLEHYTHERVAEQYADWFDHLLQNKVPVSG